MAPSQRLDLRQTQALVMTPQLQQAIKLLQLSNLQLAEYVEDEFERNPLLEREPAPIEAPAAAEAVADPEGAEAVELWHEAAGAEGEGKLDFAGDPDAWKSRRTGAEIGSDLAGLEQTLARPVTLRDHLMAQLVDFADPADRVIGAYLVELLDEAGYMTEDVAAAAARLGCAPERVEATLDRLQRFDPPGVFARSLAECLALQLRERGRLDPAMQALLDNLPLLAKHDWAALMRLCGVDAADLAEMMAEIRALNPKPGLVFDTVTAEPLVPDVLLRPQPDGGWLVELNSETLPRVLVNNRYYARVRGKARGQPERDYLAERHQAASWLVKALHQRATTILKVAREIVRQQDGFLRYGVQHLRPLVLRDIASAIGMHESTVSRVTSNKYMATPRGTFELKYFFTSAVAAASGGAAISAEAVRYRIKALIEAEAGDVLSDDRIVEMLLEEGVDIARRTVAKYREAMRIPSSVRRRRERPLHP